MTDYDRYDEPDNRTFPRPLVIVALVVIAVCVAFLIGYRIRGGPPTGRDTGASTPIGTAPAPAVPPSPPGTGGPAVPRGPLSRNSAGVITGYSHDRQGAVAAAGNYTAAVYVQTNRTHARELTVLVSVATTPADANRMAGDFTTEDSALAKLLDVSSLQSPGVIAYGHPQGYRIESATSAAATVDVYVAGGQGVADAPTGSGAAGETFYEVDQVELAWQRGDWRMTNWSHLVEDNGPELATIAAEGYQPFPIGQTDAGSGT